MMEYVRAFLAMLNEMSPYLMLGFLIAGMLHAFVPERLYVKYLSGTGLKSVVMAALVGIPLPLCSCGVLPTAVSLRRSGASRAASTSFLIATPQTGVDSISATYSMMGAPFAILRPVAALVTALVGGLAVGRMERGMDKAECGAGQCDAEEGVAKTVGKNRSLGSRVWEMLHYGFYEMLQNIGKWLVLGLVIATFITVLLPDDFFRAFADNSVLNMLVIVAVAVPMYICATGSIPIAAALMMKGMSPGCALVLLMAGPAANMASMLVVSKSFGRKTMLVYLAVIVLGAMGFGLLVDYLPGMRETFVNAMPMVHGHAHGMSVSVLNTVCSALLVTMLVVAIVGKYYNSIKLKSKNTEDKMKEFQVTGMMCNHCRSSVERGIAGLAGVTRVEVDLASGIAYVEGDVEDKTVIDKVVELGYEAVRK